MKKIIDGDEVDCAGCKFYDREDDRCTAFECFGVLEGCPPLPCESDN